MWKFAVAASVAYLIWCGVLYSVQERVMFPGAYYEYRLAGAPPEPEIIETWLTAADGSRVVAWYKRGAGRSTDEPGAAVMYFHGNGEFIDDAWLMADEYVSRGISFMAVEYRGFGRCDGEPSQAAIIEDASQFYDWLIRRPEVDPAHIIFHGRSLGGGAAAALTRERTAAGLVLESTFVSATSLASKYLAPAGLCEHPFRTDLALAEFKAPVLIIHGRRDPIIPVEHGRRLRELAKNSVYVELDKGHNDRVRDWTPLHEFLVELGVEQK